MSKNRTISFGYCMKNGVIQIEPTESKAVREIFQAYLNGSSLLAIANLMSRQGVSYSSTEFLLFCQEARRSGGYESTFSS